MSVLSNLHQRAAEHHEHAARHHREAAKLHELKDIVAAADNALDNAIPFYAVGYIDDPPIQPGRQGLGHPACTAVFDQLLPACVFR